MNLNPPKRIIKKILKVFKKPAIMPSDEFVLKLLSIGDNITRSGNFYQNEKLHKLLPYHTDEWLSGIQLPLEKLIKSTLYMRQYLLTISKIPKFSDAVSKIVKKKHLHCRFYKNSQRSFKKSLTTDLDFSSLWKIKKINE